MPTDKQKFDCVVIGSGPGGAPFAWKLASNGMKVLLLEAGPRYNPHTSYALNQDDWESKRFPERKKIRNTFGKKQPLDPDYNNLASWNKASGKLNPSKERRYLRYHQVSGIGGTTLHFQGEAHRLNENAFRMKSLYGLAVDWPIQYKDLEPYYVEAEGILGVAGPEKTPYRPRSKPYPLKPHELSYWSKAVEKACGKQGIELIPNSVAILSAPYRDAPPCNYCNGCVWGCPREDKGSVDVTFIPIIEKTGNCEIRDNVYVTRVEVEKKPSGTRAKGVVYYDRTGKEHFAGADYIAVACGAVETPKLLLNSEINNNDLVGKNFMETNFYEVIAMHPERMDAYRGIPMDSIIWKWNNPDPEKGRSGGLRMFPTAGSALGPVNYSLRYFDSWGESLVKDMETWFGHAISMGGIAEFLPNNDSFITLDPKVKDQYGSPVAQIQSFLGEPELKSLEFIAKKSKEILKAAGAGEIVEEVSSYDFFSATHVFGTCRMGKDKETSVVNPSLRVHNIPNLLVTDASVFPTSGGGEAPSLTIEALSLRAADLLLKDIKKG